MPRIYGVQSEEASHSPDRLDSLCTLLEPVPSWCRQETAAGSASLGYLGTPPGLAHYGSCLAVVDGYFCNKRELPQAPDDASRLITLYERYGFEGALGRIAGDFAVALYDASTDELWLGRDRVGTRPCYYAPFSGGVAFASRPGALLGLPRVSQKLNRSFISLYAASHYRTIDHDPYRSPYEGVRQLPAAHLARIHSGHIELRRWWNLTDAPELGGSEDELAECYRELLLTAVRERLHAARKPAFTLSGGMDSSSVLALSVRLLGGRQHAFSSVYEDKTFDESEEIASMLDATVEEWHPVRIGPVDLFAIVRKMIESHDEPVATATWLSHWLLCREVSAAGFDSLFGGLGGDELNAGEYEYFIFHFADLRSAGREAELSREIDGWARHHDHPIWRKSREAAAEGMARLVDFTQRGRCRPDRRRIRRYANALSPGYFDLGSFEPEMDTIFVSYLKNRTFQDIFREAAPCCLRAEDRQTHAFGLQNMNPFYDHRLVEFMFRIPGALKIRGGVTKYLLRQAMRGILPETTRTRIKKCGWNAPAHLWFSGKGREMLLDMVSSSQFQNLGIYNVPEVMRLINEHDQIVALRMVKENHMMFLWQMVNLYLWLTMHHEKCKSEAIIPCPSNA